MVIPNKRQATQSGVFSAPTPQNNKTGATAVFARNGVINRLSGITTLRSFCLVAHENSLAAVAEMREQQSLSNKP